MICKTLGRPWVDFRGVNEYAIKVIQVAGDIARLFVDEVDLAEDVKNDKYFRNTQDFCAAYQPHIDSVYEYSEKVERLAEVTGVWQNRTPDYCTIASVFIGLEMASRLYQHQTRLFTDELGKHIFFNPTSWQPRTREIQRVAMDLAFYLPQIGKARVVPELVSPWRGRMARPLPIGQVFILLLPDVLDNMDALWEKREQDLERGKDADSKRDVEARLKNALSAFLPPIPDEEPSTISDSAFQDGDLPRQAEAEASVQLSTGHALTTPQDVSWSANEPAHKRSCSMPRNADHSTPSSPRATPQRSTSLPPDALQLLASSLLFPTPIGDVAMVGPCGQPTNSKPSPKNLKRKRSQKGPDMRRKENRRVDPAKERQMQLDIRERFEKRLTEKQSREVARQQSQREVGIGVKNPDFMKSGRVVYGRRRFGLLDTGAFQRLPEVIQFLREWQSREAGLGANTETPDDIDDRDHGWQLRHDLRKGVDPMTIPTFRFPTSLSMAKAMLSDADLDSPNIGPDDDMYFDDGELDGYLGDDHFQKARLEMWKAQGLDKFERKDTIFSQRALDMASKRDSRVAGLISGKTKSKEKLNSARLAAVMVSRSHDVSRQVTHDLVSRNPSERIVNCATLIQFYEKNSVEASSKRLCKHRVPGKRRINKLPTTISTVKRMNSKAMCPRTMPAIKWMNLRGNTGPMRIKRETVLHMVSSIKRTTTHSR